MAKKSKSTNPLDATFDAIMKLNPKGKKGPAVFKGTQVELSVDNVISTGSIGLDMILGHGGFGGGRIMNLAGKENAGKTTFAYRLAAACKSVLWFDAEGAFDEEAFKANGGDPSKLLVTEPDMTLEDALTSMYSAVAHGIELIVLDSRDACLTRRQWEAQPGENLVGQQAKCFSENLPALAAGLRKVNSIGVSNYTKVLFLHQLRDNMSAYGRDYQFSGGRAVKHYGTYTVFITGCPTIKHGETPIGHYMDMYTEKNRVWKAKQKVKVPLLYDGYGISREWEVLDWGAKLNIIQKNGSWYSYNGTKIGQGQYNLSKILKDNPDLTDELDEKIRKSLDIWLPEKV